MLKHQLPLTPNQREYYVFYLLQPYTRLDVCGTTIYIEPFSLRVLEDSCVIMEEMCENSRFDERIRQADLLSYLYQYGGWTQTLENEYKVLPSRLDYAKKNYYLAYTKKQNLEPYSATLKKYRKRYKELSEKRSIFNGGVVENIATRYKLAYQIYACAKTEKGKLFDCSFEEANGYFLNNILLAYQHSILGEDIIRDLVINLPWSSMWHTRKSIRIFRKLSHELTINQQSLLGWSNFYDSVYKSSDRPSRTVIEDVDLVDGWMMHIQDKYESHEVEQERPGRTNTTQYKFKVINNQEDLEELEHLQNR